MKVPFVDLTLAHKEIKEELLGATSRIIDKSQFILGDDLAEFEKKFAEFCNMPFALGVGCGLDALKISLEALNLKAGDEIIVPAHTYIATWLAISGVGASIIPVDACAKTMNIDVDLVENLITGKTKAIIPVHMYGQMCDMDLIMSLATKHSLYVIEDFAQAQGASFNRKKAGSFGHVNATSFYPGKNIGALGDGGAILTKRKSLYEKILKLRNYGSKIKYVHEIIGQNSRLDNLQAAFLNIKLKHLAKWNMERREIAKRYIDKLKNIHEIILPETMDKAEHVFHLFVIRTEQRDSLQAYLIERNIFTVIHYPSPPFLQEAYKHLNIKRGSYPEAEKIANTGLSLPIFPGLTIFQIEYVCDAIKSFFNK